MTLAIVAVFVPVAFMEGIMGRFFYQFGVTVAVAVLISYFVSMTLTAHALGPPPQSTSGEPGVIGRGIERVLTAIGARLPRRAALGAGPPRRSPWPWRWVVLVATVFMARFLSLHLHPRSRT